MRRLALDLSPRSLKLIKSAFWVGVAQCASLIPGMSRSGSTIIGGLLVATLLFVIVFNFFLFRVLPGDPGRNLGDD